MVMPLPASIHRIYMRQIKFLRGENDEKFSNLNGIGLMLKHLFL